MVPEPYSPRLRQTVWPYLEMSSDGSSATAQVDHVSSHSAKEPHVSRRRTFIPGTDLPGRDPSTRLDDAPRLRNVKGPRSRTIGPRYCPTPSSNRGRKVRVFPSLSRLPNSDVSMNPVDPQSSIRPFVVSVPEAQLADLRRRIAATRWPSQELVPDASQGVQLATMRELARSVADRLRLAQVRSEAERPAAVRDDDRRRRHPLHPRSLEASERVAGHRHARLAGLGHRADEDHRAR